MIHDLQKASVWKRISAALLDFVILFVAVEGLILLLSTALGFQSYLDRMDTLKESYLEKYGIERILSGEELSKLPTEAQEVYKAKVEAANKASQHDEEFIGTYGKIISLSLVMTTLSVLVAYLLLEFAVPLWLKNGQTIGKKAFGIAVVRIDGVRVAPVAVFARNILGKCTIGMLAPIYLVIMVFFGIMGMVGVFVFVALFLLQAILFFATKYHTPIHDKLSQTVAVDITAQLIFDSVEEMLEYKKQLSAKEAEKSTY